MKFLLALLCVVHVCLAVPKLGRYNVDKEGISVSGLSAGAAFATNFHVVHSSEVIGLASFAGIPYWCPMGLGVTQALTVCMNLPSTINVNTLISTTESRSASGAIDDMDNLQGSRIYIWHGTGDSTVRPAASAKMEEYYENFGADIVTNLDMNAGHGQPTVDFGVACTASSSPYVNRCEFDGAFHGLNHIYGGNLEEPSGDVELAGTFSDFDQSDFANTGSFDSAGGYIYVPSGCQEQVKRDTCSMDPAEREDCGFGGISPEECEAEGCCFDSGTPDVPWCFHPQATDQACKLHVAFHGCLQGREFIGDDYARNAGYLEVGELNNIIMLFPQIRSNILLGNLNGCFDWWGFDPIIGGSSSYATRTGVQISSVKAMIDHIVG